MFGVPKPQSVNTIINNVNNSFVPSFRLIPNFLQKQSLCQHLSKFPTKTIPLSTSFQISYKNNPFVNIFPNFLQKQSLCQHLSKFPTKTIPLSTSFQISYKNNPFVNIFPNFLQKLPLHRCLCCRFLV